MQYIRSTAVTALQTLANRLQSELGSGKRVLWLVSGGSNIGITVQIMASLPSELTHALTIGLIDERYGEVGHTDSNWQALLQAGVDFKHATAMPVLLLGHDRRSTTEHYARTLMSMLNEADISIGLLGLGTDGHTAGILPLSPATQDSEALVVDYASNPYERITLSFAGLRRLDVAYLFAFGTEKSAVVRELVESDQPLGEQPAQIIKHIHESYVYNDEQEGVTT